MLDIIKSAYDSVCETVVSVVKSGWDFLKSLFTLKTVKKVATVAMIFCVNVGEAFDYKNTLKYCFEGSFMIIALLMGGILIVLDWPVFLLFCFFWLLSAAFYRGMAVAAYNTYCEVC